MRWKQVSILFLLSLVIGCKKKETENINLKGIQHDCVHSLTNVIVYDIFSPPVSSRIYAYCNLAYYEALRFEGQNAKSIAAQLHGFEKLPVPIEGMKYDFKLAATKAFYNVARALTFSKDSLTSTEDRLINSFQNSLEEEVFKRSILFGTDVAEVILNRATNDNYKITRGMPKYSVFAEAGKWQQTPPDYSDAAEPHWSLIKPLLLDSAAQFKPSPPPAFDLSKESLYYKELMEVYDVSKKIDSTQKTIARFWDDNPFVTEHKGHLMFATKKITPGGHWMGIVSILCKQTNADDLRTARAYAITSAAMFDGFISCWDEKYRSRFVRPVTVIRDHIEPTWTPYLQTPPFPEYTSGHSVVSSSASTVLTELFGENLNFNDTSEVEYLGLQRSFTSIKAASDEACISRLYGGIHYRAAIEQGKLQGQRIGAFYHDLIK